jgi:NADPH2:quinone reductase
MNFADLLMAKGTYQDTPSLPFTMGLELAGEVLRAAPDVTVLGPCDRVMIYSGQGGYAEAGNFPATRAVPIPDSMTFEHAAAFPIAYGTSHLALEHKARLLPGEKLLVLGAAGGVGLTAVEIGKRMGARVIACARGDKKLSVARAAGADHVIDSETEDLTEAVRALGGADVVYDPVGGDMFRAAFRATKPDGRILVVGFASGSVPPIPANHMLVKNITVIGIYWGGYLNFAPDILTGSLRTLVNWYDEGGLRPHVSQTLPLERALEGVELLRSRRATGKLVITP